MQCVVLAGGLGTRIATLAPDVPKALIPIRGRPFADYQLSLLAKNGVRDVVYCIGHLGQAIRDHVGAGERFRLSVRYVDEGETRRGTGGALRLAAESGALAERFFVLYGDSYLPIDYRAVWDAFAHRREAALMTVFRNQERWDRSNVVFADRRVLLYDKRRAEPPDPRMTYIDYGLSVLKAGTVERYVPPNENSDLADAYHRMSIEGQLLGHEVSQRFYEIGSPAGLAEFARYAASA